MSDINNIVRGLQPGNRLAYREGKFESVSKREAKRLAKTDPGAITDLATLTEKIGKFIDKEKLSQDDIQRIKNALNTRETNLENRLVLFGRAKKRAALSTMHQLRDSLVTSIIAQRAISKDVRSTAAPPPQPAPVPTQPPAQTAPSTPTRPPSPAGPSSTAAPATPAPPAAPPPTTTAPPPPTAATPPPMGGPPPPPPPGGGKILRFPGEPEPPTFSRTNLSGKTPAQLKQEINEINTYLAQLEEALGPARADSARHKAAGEELREIRAEIQQARAARDRLEPILKELLKMWNEKRGGTFIIDSEKGSAIEVYTDEEYAAEVKKREENPKEYRKHLPLGEFNKLSFLLRLFNTAYRDNNAKLMRKGEDSLRILDEQNREMAPAKFERVGARYSVEDLDLKGNVVPLSKKPKELKMTAVEARQTSAQLQAIDRLEREMATLEGKTYGPIPFSRLDTFLGIRRKKYIQPWKVAIHNREQILAGKAPDVAKAEKAVAEDVWGGILAERPELVQQLAGLAAIGAKTLQTLALNPADKLLSMVLSGEGRSVVQMREASTTEGPGGEET